MKIADINPPMSELLPHDGRMLLLDRLVSCDAECAVAEITVPANGLFMQSAGMPAWVGLEYMAQTVGAWAGYHARKRNLLPKIGFLLGTRSYQCSVQYFPIHSCLYVEVRSEFISDNGLCMFACRILLDDSEVATAKVSVFEPADAAAFLQGENS